MLRLLRHSLLGLSSSAVLCGRHHQSGMHSQSTAAAAAAGNMREQQAAAAEAVSAEKVWALWNEGNLFSLSLAQLQGFLARAGVRTEPSAKKAAVVRQVEEYLHSKDIAVKNGGQSTQNQQQQHQGGGGGGYGRWNQSTVMQPETLLDLAQAGFYEGSANMAPKAFQLLVSNTAADVVVSRVNTTAFPGFPANTECYTLSASEKDVAIRSRYSKVLQWCCLNMSNLQMDGELFVDFGKLLLQPSVMRKNRRIVSSFTLQQRMQVSHPYTWVSALPESSVHTIQEELLKPEGFMPLGKGGQITYSGTIKRAKDQVNLEFDNKGKVLSVNSAWVNVQTAWCTRARGPDVRLLLRSRPPIRRQEVEMYASMPIIQLSEDDVADVLPAEHGQLVYLSEDETRLFEKVTEKGVKFTVKEVKRQPLIVLRDDEEDPRLEYSLSVAIPANAGKATDVRAVGLAAFELAGKLAGLVTEDYVKEYGCEAAL
ncbi:mitochondrial guide RNA binding complex subunit 1 [Trypanosoma theileri]|uniref:Mitochondrial guide RNA binding complex subunit 1 n=1 Tax=Trypanosoma theileri TaxID=67003 RepID=A0A1X0NTQ0_9TRYP|nr:mitochondrial guide RNA binding complex subunit 1 [Trypanosoma theileri]ORC87918.1 mitochondrial guide RNA binding complex subunit 1 [Trypanosoma theileri]